MFKLNYLSRDDSYYYKNNIVFFCCHNNDFDNYFKKITANILNASDSLVVYKTTDERCTNEEYEAFFSHVSMLVVPVTKQFIEDESCNCMIEFQFALKRNIPIVPVICESGVENRFNKISGNLHSVNIASPTYVKQLEGYIKNFLTEDLLLADIKGVFKGKLFISYRKKDHLLAEKVIKRIHSLETFRDVSCWIDDYLTIGENFDDEIEQNLKDSNAVIVVETDNIWNEKNYVIDCELPKAKEYNKPQLYVNCGLSDAYSHLVENIDISETNKLENFMESIFEKANIENSEKQYFLGLAYLRGVMVERNSEYALSLLKKAYSDGYVPAFTELSNMYRYGNGVERDKNIALKYAGELLLFYGKSFKENKDFESAESFLKSAIEYYRISNEFGDGNSGSLALMKSASYESEIESLFGDKIAYMLGLLNSEIAKIKMNTCLYEEALSHINKAIKYFEKNDDFISQREIVTTLVEKAFNLLNEGDCSQGLNILYGTVVSFGDLYEKTESLSAARDYTNTLQRLCFVILKLDDIELNEVPFNPNDLYESLVELSKSIYEKTREKEDFVNIARAYNYMGEWLYRNKLWKFAVNHFCGANNIMNQTIDNKNTNYAYLIFKTKITKNIGDSFMQLEEYKAAYNAYSESYSLAYYLYEGKQGDENHILVRLSELSEGLADASMKLYNKVSMPDLLPPDVLYNNALDFELLIYEKTKNSSRYQERVTKIKAKKH